jgi:YVTN family beta-propeller protein
VIDTATNTIVATMALSGRPSDIAINADGTRVYVADASFDKVSVIDTATNTVVATVVVGDGPFAVAVNSAGTRVYVTNLISNSVSVIETATNTVVATIIVGDTPYGVAVNSAGMRVYVANANGHSVSVIDTAINMVVVTVPARGSPASVAIASSQAFARVIPNATSFSAGQRLVLSLYASNPESGEPLDLYVGALFPDNNTIAFLVAPNVIGGLGHLNAPASVAPFAIAEGGYEFNGFPVLSFTFPASGLPTGTYRAFAGWFGHGSLADNAINSGDLLWLDTANVPYSP